MSLSLFWNGGTQKSAEHLIGINAWEGSKHIWNYVRENMYTVGECVLNGMKNQNKDANYLLPLLSSELHESPSRQGETVATVRQREEVGARLWPGERHMGNSGAWTLCGGAVSSSSPSLNSGGSNGARVETNTLMVTDPKGIGIRPAVRDPLSIWGVRKETFLLFIGRVLKTRPPHFESERACPSVNHFYPRLTLVFWVLRRPSQ